MSANNFMRYTRSARWLHWSMAVLIVLAYVLINSGGQFERGSELRTLVVQSHYWVGIVIFALAFPRLWHRYSHCPPDIAPPLARLAQRLASVLHYALYAFLFMQPILGMLTVLIGKGSLPMPVAGWAIPSPFPVSKDEADALGDIHALLGTVFYYVIGLHIAAALFHHYVRRDNTLKRML